MELDFMELKFHKKMPLQGFKTPLQGFLWSDQIKKKKIIIINNKKNFKKKAFMF